MSCLHRTYGFDFPCRKLVKTGRTCRNQKVYTRVAPFFGDTLVFIVPVAYWHDIQLR